MGVYNATKVWGGRIPVAGSIINGAQALYHVGAAGIDGASGDSKGAYDHMTSAGWSALKAIPFAGTGLSAVEMFHDHVEGGKVPEPEPGQSYGKPNPTLKEKFGEAVFGPAPSTNKTEAPPSDESVTQRMNEIDQNNRQAAGDCGSPGGGGAPAFCPPQSGGPIGAPAAGTNWQNEQGEWHSGGAPWQDESGTVHNGDVW
jgi:hypothetical protein